MARESDETGISDAGVLRSKRNATVYEILVEVAERQPAVSQREIAEAIDVTPQAVSEYLKRLVEAGYVESHGRGRYEITKEGVDWLISRTNGLRAVVEHVSTEVIGQVEIEAAIATGPIAEGQTVSLSMDGGVLRATPGVDGGPSAVAVTDGESGGDVGVTDFEGMLDYELGRVTVVSVPTIDEGGSAAIEEAAITEALDEHDLLAVAGTEALAAIEALAIEPDIRFGAASAIEEAAAKGLDVVLIAVSTRVSEVTEGLRDLAVEYEVRDPNGG